MSTPAALPILLAENGGSAFSGLLPIILMFVVVYLIVLRPMSKQEKDRRKRLEALQKGDQIVLGGGIIGRISNNDDPKVLVVEIADKVKVRVLRKDVADLYDPNAPAGKEGKAAAKADDKAQGGDEARKGAE